MVTVPLAMDYGLRGALSVSGGWIARGERLLADEPEGLSTGISRWCAARTSSTWASSSARRSRFSARELAVRHGDRSLETTALVFEGAIRVWTGDVEAGIAILDEATAAATSGELDPLATGIVYCVTIDSCQALATADALPSGPRSPTAGAIASTSPAFPGRAASTGLRSSGSAATGRRRRSGRSRPARSFDYNRSVTAAGFYEIGEIRRRQGAFAAAEEAYRKADDLGRDLQPGLALLRLAQGRSMRRGRRSGERLRARSSIRWVAPSVFPLRSRSRLPQVELRRARRPRTSSRGSPTCTRSTGAGHPCSRAPSSSPTAASGLPSTTGTAPRRRFAPRGTPGTRSGLPTRRRRRACSSASRTAGKETRTGPRRS